MQLFSTCVHFTTKVITSYKSVGGGKKKFSHLQVFKLKNIDFSKHVEH